MTIAGAHAQAPGPELDPVAMRRSPQYVRLLVLAALVGIPVAAVAYLFQWLVSEAQQWLFTTAPGWFGLDPVPWWWPVPVLALAGLLVALAIDRLPGEGGHPSAMGVAPGGPVLPPALPGIALAAFASLAAGAVLGPEAPLVAIGSGLAVLAVRLAKKDAPQQLYAVLAAAGSFAAISTLLGSPLLGAFLLMEAAGLSGAVLGLVLLPGLLAAGIGTLVFLGIDSVTGLGTFSLAIPGLPEFSDLTGVMFLWALGFGIAAGVLGWAIRLLGVAVQQVVTPRRIVLTPLLGVLVALIAGAYALITDRPFGDVLFSGEQTMAPMVESASSYAAGTLVLLMLCKSLAYGLSLGGFRGGPTFPAMFVGAAGGVLVSNTTGLALVPAVGMGIAAMCAVMLELPLTSVLLASVFLSADSLQVIPVVIVAVVVAYVTAARLPDPRDRVRAAQAQAAPAG